MKRIVAKLGGSMAGSFELGDWIEALTYCRMEVVVVPGGGPFREQVKKAQAELGFSDAAAHQMAILAMDQFGHVIVERDPALAPARSLDEIERMLGGRGIPVWLPSSLAGSAPDIPVSWDVTSDSLAAWLAGKLCADALLLVKQTDAFTMRDDLVTLRRRGIVDRALETMLPAGVELFVAGPRHAEEAEELFAAWRLPGFRIERSSKATRRAG